MASAASWTSVVRLPAVPSCRSKEKASSRWRGPGRSRRTLGIESHASTRSTAAPTSSGSAKTRGFVVRRMKPKTTGAASPTSPPPLRRSTHHRAARACSGNASTSAYRTRFRSGTTTAADLLERRGVLELVHEAVEAHPIEAGQQPRVVRLQAIGRRAGTGTRRQAPAQRVVHDLLEAAPLPVRLLAEHS